MDDRFKFRVWDKITNQYLQELGIYYWHIPYSLDGEEITGEANLVGLSELLKHDNFITQQYTGLTDSNDKPIYEGDIVKDTWRESHPYSYRPDEEYNHDEIFEVKYKDYSFNLDKKYSREQTHIEGFRREVIGNIFETPQLLK